METAKEIVESFFAKAAMEKLKEMNMAENAKEIVSKTTPFVSNLYDWLLKTSEEIVVNTTLFVRTSSNWLLEKAPPLISTAISNLFEWLLKTSKEIVVNTTLFVRTASNWLLEKAPLYYTIPIGFLLIWLLHRCGDNGDGGCNGRGGGNGGVGNGGTEKMMKAPGRKNVRMARRDFESNPKSYFRKLRSKKK